MDFSRYSGSRASEAGWRGETEAASEAGWTEDSRGTKAYFHPIPGLGAGTGGAGGVGSGGYGRGSYGGFRRGRGRRDSLSDSEEGETVMS